MNATQTTTTAATAQGKKKALRGFAAMDPQRQREIASMGGRAAHENGTAHEFTSEEARAAGRKLAAMRAALQQPGFLGTKS